MELFRRDGVAWDQRSREHENHEILERLDARVGRLGRGIDRRNGGRSDAAHADNAHGNNGGTPFFQLGGPLCRPERPRRFLRGWCWIAANANAGYNLMLGRFLLERKAKLATGGMA